MGIVYKAYDPKIDRPVAIKTISLHGFDASEEQAMRARFFREAEAAGRLTHPRIVAVYDVGEDPDTLTPYIVMEYVSGHSLEEMLGEAGVRLPWHKTLRLTQEVAEALDYAHLQGVVHRDIKPSNILVGDDGHAKIVDFGIAQLTVTESSRPGRTLGTPAYMSPEQLRGESVDGRSDLFSLGVVLYRMLTGHRPFQGNSARTVSLRVVNHDPIPAKVFNTELPPELDSVIERAIAKTPAERYQTGMEMVRDLQRLREGIPSECGEDATRPEADKKTHQPASLTDIFFSRESNVRSLDKAKARVQYKGPWQQLGIALATHGTLALAFLGLWKGIPTRAAAQTPHQSSQAQFHTGAGVNIIIPDAKNPPPVIARSIQLRDDHRPRGLPPKDLRQGDHRFSSNQDSCLLGVVVEHHFAMADLSVSVDDQASYSYNLRGAVKKRDVIFKGIEGYLSDVVHLTPGTHDIHVRVVSADGSYDESDSIAAPFTPGSRQLLAIGFDRHNRRMHLTFEPETDLVINAPADHSERNRP